MFLIEYKELSWWLWLVSAVLIGIGIYLDPRLMHSGMTGGLFVASTAFKAVIVLSIAQIFLYTILEKSVTAFPVQMRFVFTLIVSIAYFEPMRWFYWVPFIGTSVGVVTGYCLLARILSLLPINRTEPLTSSLIRRTIFSKPVAGSILQGLPPHKESC